MLKTNYVKYFVRKLFTATVEIKERMNGQNKNNVYFVIQHIIY